MLERCRSLVPISACHAEDPLSAADIHSARSVFDDSVLPDRAAYLAEVAARRMAMAKLGSLA